MGSPFRPQGGLPVLIERGADLEAKDERGRTALWYAATRGHIEIVKLLMENGANPKIMDNLGQTLPQAAQAAGQVLVVAYLYGTVTSVSLADVQSEVAAAVEKARAGQSSRRAAKKSDVDFPSFQLAPRENDFALIIGIEGYKSLPEADYAARDSESVRRYAEALGIPRQNIVYLAGSNATRAALEGQLSDWLPRNVKPDSQLLFYFSGHGSADPATGDAYLLPWDGDPSFLTTSALSIRGLQALLDKIPARGKTLVLDTCFSGAGGRSVMPKGARPLVSKLALGTAAGNTILLAAAGAGQITGSLEEQGHGLFTYYFLKGLNGAAKDGSGDITSESLYWYLKPLVQEAARRQNRDQTPLLNGLSPQVLVPAPK